MATWCFLSVSGSWATCLRYSLGATWQNSWYSLSANLNATSSGKCSSFCKSSSSSELRGSCGCCRFSSSATQRSIQCHFTEPNIGRAPKIVLRGRDPYPRTPPLSRIICSQFINTHVIPTIIYPIFTPFLIISNLFFIRYSISPVNFNSDLVFVTFCCFVHLFYDKQYFQPEFLRNIVQRGDKTIRSIFCQKNKE